MYSFILTTLNKSYTRIKALARFIASLRHRHYIFYNRFPPAPMHDDVIKWKHFPRYWSFVWGIHWSPVNSPRKGHWRGALMFSSICSWINGWENNGDAGDLRRQRAHYDVIVMACVPLWDNPGHRFSHHHARFELEMIRGIFMGMVDNHIFEDLSIVHEVINRHFSVHSILISSRLKHNVSSTVDQRLQFR